MQSGPTIVLVGAALLTVVFGVSGAQARHHPRAAAAGQPALIHRMS